MTGATKIEEAGQPGPPGIVLSSNGLGVDSRAGRYDLTDETIRELCRRLPSLRSELNDRNYPVNEADFKEYAATIAAEISKIMRAGF